MIGPLFDIRGVQVAVSICEDAWEPGPVVAMAANGAELVVNINASPYLAGRLRERETMLAERAAQASVPIVYVNLVGGQDELVFDGASVAFDDTGRLAARAHQFDEDLLVVDVEIGSTISGRVEPVLDPVPEVYEALVFGTRDYVRKNGFTDVFISLSGGVDSSLVAAIAVDALGAAHVHGVMLPSRFSSEGSVTERRRSPPTSVSAPTRCRSRRRKPRSRTCWRPCSTVGHPTSPKKTCRPGSAATRHDHLEQVRMDGAVVRQQERDGDRLLDAVR